MFSTERRDEIHELLVARARADPRITGAAVTGSAARGAADRWSDIDLYFGVAEPATAAALAEEWTAFARDELGALHHFELTAGPAVYRALLLGDLLELDLGFAPAAMFRPLGDGRFHVLFGEAGERRTAPADPDHLTGLGWHHVLHARAAIERDRPWRAEYWISALRDRTADLACARLGLPVDHAKGTDLLPPEATEPLRPTLVRSLDPAELRRALRAATTAYLTEAAHASPAATAALRGPLLAAVGAGTEG